MGIYTRLSDVPDDQCLSRYAADYEQRDVFEDYLTTFLFEQFSSERFQEDARRAGRRWKTHLTERDRHHALATPEDVECWCETLLANYKIKTAYNSYWIRIEDFYTWLQSHTEHPHCYHPVLMAASNYPSAGELWAEKIRRGQQ